MADLHEYDVELTASDGHRLNAYRADPSNAAKGGSKSDSKSGIVVLQEIFGVNHHIRNVCDRLAREGYKTIAPALFDRQQRNFQSGYSPDEVAIARRFIASPDMDAMLRDIQAAIDALAAQGPVGIVGFCLGGSLAFLAATRLGGIAASIGYYGGRIKAAAHEVPRVPVQLHFGEIDQSIALSDVAIIQAARKDCDIYIYPGAQHGFNCDERASYDSASAALAWRRSLDFLKTHLKNE